MLGVEAAVARGNGAGFQEPGVTASREDKTALTSELVQGDFPAGNRRHSFQIDAVG